MDGFFGPSAEMKGSKEKKEIRQFLFVQVPEKCPTVDQFVFHASKKEKKVWIKKKPKRSCVFLQSGTILFWDQNLIHHMNHSVGSLDVGGGDFGIFIDVQLAILLSKKEVVVW